jgi:propanediol dehydratase small subunit
MTPDMQAQIQRVLSYINVLQNQITSQQLLITSLQNQLSVAQGTAQTSTDAITLAAELTAVNVP